MFWFFFLMWVNELQTLFQIWLNVVCFEKQSHAIDIVLFCELHESYNKSRYLVKIYKNMLAPFDKALIQYLRKLPCSYGIEHNLDFLSLTHCLFSPLRLFKYWMIATSKQVALIIHLLPLISRQPITCMTWSGFYLYHVWFRMDVWFANINKWRKPSPSRLSEPKNAPWKIGL